VFVLEERTEIFRRKDVVELTADRMDGVIRESIGGDDGSPHRNTTAVGGDLPLVVADDAELQQLAEILFQWKNLANSPFVGEGLPRCLVGVIGALPLSVSLPVREQVQAGSFTLGNVVGNFPFEGGCQSNLSQRCLRLQGGNGPVGTMKASPTLDVRSLEVPAQGKRLNP
jgi:hypothetical protein